jgi:superfamily II DNA or RNA helicase
MNEQIVIEVGNVVSSIVHGVFDKDTYKAFRQALGYRPEGWKHAIRSNAAKVEAQGKALGWSEESIKKAVARAKSWDGYISNVRYNAGHCGYYQKRKYTHFSTGLISTAREFFDKYSIPYSLVDVRDKCPIHDKDFHISDEMEERDYQIDAKDKACKKQRGIIKCATGGGKTVIAASIIAELGVTPTVFYVTSVDLLRQAHDELSKFIHYHGISMDVGMVGGGHKDIRDITVMTVQTAIRSLGEKYSADFKFDDEDKEDKMDISDIKADINNLIRSSKCIVFDECQHVAAKTCQLIADHSENAYYRYGMSATPYRDMGDDIMIEACFGKPIVDISASFLIRKGYLVKPDIFFLTVDNMSDCPYSTYAKIYRHALKENPLRNRWIAQIATQMHSEGRLPLILCKHIDHGKLLKSMIPGSTFLHGTISKKKRLEHLNLMRDRDCGVTIATSIFDEGIDVKPLDSLILAGSGKSATRALQRIGRILRPWPNRDNNKKKDAIAVDFVDKCNYLEEHSQRRLDIYKTEDEFNIKALNL